MKRFFTLFLLSILYGNAFCQVLPDTIGKYPLLYYYNFPELAVTHDGMFCSTMLFMYPADLDQMTYWQDRYSGGETLNKFATYMHSDDTLHIIGIATGHTSDRSYDSNDHTRLTIYSPDMKPMAFVDADRSEYQHYGEPLDSNYIVLVYPLDTSTVNYAMNYYGALKLSYFNTSEPIKVAGDFYVGLEYFFDYSQPSWADDVLSIQENHDPPYNFPERPYRMMVDGVWEDHVSVHSCPLIFPILDLPCEKLPTLDVVSDSTGCLSAQWEPLTLQTRWVVALGNGVETVYDTVDTCFWRHCGLEPHRPYTVSVRSQCRTTSNPKWAEWSNNAIGRPDGRDGIRVIREEQRLFSVAPNPARGAATVTLAAEAAATGCSLTLRDEAGRIAMQRTVAAGTAAVVLDLRGLEAGVYVITVSSAAGVETGKLKIEKW